MSFEIIDNTKDWSAKYVYQPPPDFRLSNHPTLEAQKYYEKQHQIWAEGYYRDGQKVLSGKHYFYIQECWLKTGRGHFIRPYWKDTDDLVFSTIDECMRDPDHVEDLFILKRREIGMTSMIAGGLSFWFARMFPGTTLNITSADKRKFVRMFEDKIIVAYNRMSPYIMNCTPKNINRSANNAYLKVGMKEKQPDGSVEDKETEFNLVETSQSDDSVANFSASRTPFMFVDEIFLHPRAIKLIRSARATMMEGTSKFGFFIGGGTCEESVSQDQLKAYRELWDSAEKKGIRTLFLSAWMGLPQCSKNGWSDEKAGTEWVLKELEKAEKSGDLEDLISKKKQYPLTTDDVWKLADGDGFFEQDVMELLDYTHEQLCKEPSNPEYQAKLINTGGGIVIVPDNKPRGKNDGGFWVIEGPEDGQKYYQEIDGAASGKEDGAEEGSWVASTIYKDISLKGDHYAPVCHYFERPNRLEDGYRNAVTQFRCYDKFGGMIHTNYETNAGQGGNFGTYLDAEGLFKRIMRRKDLTAKGNIDVNKLGTAVDENIKRELTGLANRFLRKFAGFIRSRMLLAALLARKGDNSDLRSNFLIFMASIKGWEKPKKKLEKHPDRIIHQLVRTESGIRWKQKKIPSSNQTVHPQDLSELTRFQQEMEKKYGAYWYQKSSQKERQKFLELKGDPNPTRPMFGNF